MPYVVYILKCSDGSCYIGSTADLSKRLWEHETGAIASAYTYTRRPVQTVFSIFTKNPPANRWSRGYVVPR